MAKQKKKAESAGASGAVRAIVFTGVALTFGVVGIIVLYMLINSYQQQIAEAKKPEDTVMVIVAARDLYQGVTIAEEDLYAVEIPPRFLPENVFLTPEHVLGRIPRERILANEFIRADRLADPESGIGLNAVIPRGMRAISVNISDGRALSGFLNPTNYVDVLVTITPEEGSGSGETSTKTIMQAVFVLGVNSRRGNESAEQAAEARGPATPSVTLLVTAEGAETIAYAESQGRITLALRNDLDIAYAETQGVDVEALRRKLEKPKPVKQRAAAPPAEAAGAGLIIIKGKEREEKRTDAAGNIK